MYWGRNVCKSRGGYILTSCTTYFTLCLIFRRFWPIYILYSWCDRFIVLQTLNTQYIPYISVTHKVLKSCRSKMATLAHDVCDVHGAFLLYVKTCWQSLYRVFPTGGMGESPHQPKICSFTPSPPNFYSFPPKVNST